MSNKLYRFTAFLLVFAVILPSFGTFFAPVKTAATVSVSVGDTVSSLAVEGLKSAGYTFIDNTDTDINYAWPYNLPQATADCPSAYGGSVCWQLGQVSATLNYTFTGNYIAVAYVENYWAAEIYVTIDGTEYTAVTPFSKDAPKESPETSTSKIVFVKDDLSDGEHTVVISHKAGHNSGEDNVKADGQAYYDNDAMFDCFIIRKTEEKPEEKTFKVPEVGDLAKKIDPDLFAQNGYIVVDDRDENIVYTWPYTHEQAPRNCSSALNKTVTFQLGQVGATISYDFTGTFLAILFCENYYAAECHVNIDGVDKGTFIPYAETAPEADKSIGTSKVYFVCDDLEDTEHTVVITHTAGHSTGKDNVKADGQAYYDNDAVFDAFIVKKSKASESVPESVQVGVKMKKYTDEMLAEWNLKVIDNTDEGFYYTWPFDLQDGGALVPSNTAYGGNFQFNNGQVGATITYEFEGTYLACAFAETYYACKVYIDVDGDIIGEFTPHSLIRPSMTDVADSSKIFFIADNLTPGEHVMVILLETDYLSGEDNEKADGNLYYDNNTYFDCIIVQKEPTPPTERPATEVPAETATPEATQAPVTLPPATSAPTASKPTASDTPEKDSGSNTGLFIGIIAAGCAVIAGAIAVIIVKKKKST